MLLMECISAVNMVAAGVPIVRCYFVTVGLSPSQDILSNSDLCNTSKVLQMLQNVTNMTNILFQFFLQSFRDRYPCKVNVAQIPHYVPLATANLTTNGLQYTLLEQFVLETKAARLQPDQMALKIMWPPARYTV